MGVRAFLSSNGHLLAFVVPLAVVVFTVLGRRFYRRDGGWRLTDFCVGPPLALSAFGAACFFLFELSQLTSRGQVVDLLYIAWFIPFSIALLGITIGLHFTYEGRTENPLLQSVWLLFAGNAAGVASWGIFLLVVKA